MCRTGRSCNVGRGHVWDPHFWATWYLTLISLWTYPFQKAKRSQKPDIFKISTAWLKFHKFSRGDHHSLRLLTRLRSAPPLHNALCGPWYGDLILTCAVSILQRHHYRELPENVREALGSIPDGYIKYFTTRFPKLLMHTYYAMANYTDDQHFQAYYS